MTDIEIINNYTQKELSEEDVFVFSLTLCDNEIDRDFECFPRESLEKLKELFVGKTGIFDHSASASDQNARIFATEVVEVENAKTSYGAAYCKLTAKAYMVRTDTNASLIREIEGGIKKEVSIGCSVSGGVCSICGEAAGSHKCRHKKGKNYNGNVCYFNLEDPYDAYEWSFVAIPAQRNAGVAKSFRDFMGKSYRDEGESVILAKSELSDLVNRLEVLERDATFGGKYRKFLKESIRRNLAVYNLEIDSSAVLEFADSLGYEELEEFERSINKMVRKAGRVQTAAKIQNNI